MATPEEWLARAQAAADEMALRLAGRPAEAIEADLARFADRTRAGWRRAFAALPIAPEDIDSMVADLVGRINTRRREMEGCSGQQLFIAQ